jgi:uncharacterized protein (TIGR02444 family)
MAEDAEDGDAGNAFWAFSLSFYAAPGVAETCLALQDEAGVDVNLLLFALWHAASGRGILDEAALAGAAAATAEWRGCVVEPLRAVRRFLKGAAPESALRAAVKAAELQAEEAAQRHLAALAAPVGRQPAEGEGALALDRFLAFAGVEAPRRLEAAARLLPVLPIGVVPSSKGAA